MLTLLRRLYAGEAVFDFIGSRKRWYWVSVALLLICVGSFVFRGFNFGIEFSGGTTFQFRAVAAEPAQAQEAAEAAGAEVAATPQVVGGGGTRSILIRTGELTPAEQTTVQERAGVPLRPGSDRPGGQLVLGQRHHQRRRSAAWWSSWSRSASSSRSGSSGRWRSARSPRSSTTCC